MKAGPSKRAKRYMKKMAKVSALLLDECERRSGWEKIYIKPDMFPMGQEPLPIHEDEHGTYYYDEEQPDDGRLMAGDSNGGK